MGTNIENAPTMISHAKEENVVFLFPINNPISFMNAYPAEKGKNKQTKKTKLNSIHCSQLSVGQKFKPLH